MSPTLGWTAPLPPCPPALPHGKDSAKGPRQLCRQLNPRKPTGLFLQTGMLSLLLARLW